MISLADSTNFSELSCRHPNDACSSSLMIWVIAENELEKLANTPQLDSLYLESTILNVKITLFQRTSGYSQNLGVGNSTNFIIKKLTTASVIEAATIMNI
jgi:hypothetical protein